MLEKMIEKAQLFQFKVQIAELSAMLNHVDELQVARIMTQAFDLRYLMWKSNPEIASILQRPENYSYELRKNLAASILKEIRQQHKDYEKVRRNAIKLLGKEIQTLDFQNLSLRGAQQVWLATAVGMEVDVALVKGIWSRLIECADSIESASSQRSVFSGPHETSDGNLVMPIDEYQKFPNFLPEIFS